MCIISVTFDSTSSWKNFSLCGPINGPLLSIICCIFCTGTSCGCSDFILTLMLFYFYFSSECLLQKIILRKFFTCVSVLKKHWWWARPEFNTWYLFRPGHDLLLSWLWLSSCSQKSLNFIWTAGPTFFTHCKKINEIANLPCIGFLSFSFCLWNMSANIKVCLEIKYFNVILSDPSSLFTARTRAVKRV